MELGGNRGVPFVHCLDIVEEHGKRYPIVEGMMKDNDKVVFVGGYVTKVDWGAVKRNLGVELEALNELLRRVIYGSPLLGSPLEVEG